MAPAESGRRGRAEPAQPPRLGVAFLDRSSAEEVLGRHDMLCYESGIERLQAISADQQMFATLSGAGGRR